MRPSKTWKLCQEIENLEIEKHRLFELLASPTFYAVRGDEVARTKQQLAAVEDEIQKAYARWLELDALARGDAE